MTHQGKTLAIYSFKGVSCTVPTFPLTCCRKPLCLARQTQTEGHVTRGARQDSGMGSQESENRQLKKPGAITHNLKKRRHVREKTAISEWPPSVFLEAEWPPLIFTAKLDSHIHPHTQDSFALAQKPTVSTTWNQLVVAGLVSIAARVQMLSVHLLSNIHSVL